MSVKYYSGDNIYFRPLEVADVDALVTWLNDEDNWSTLGRSNPINRLREREYVEGLYKSPTDVSLGIVTQEGDALIGCFGLHQACAQSRRATFGLLIGDRKRQGAGFGTEATKLAVRYGFEEMNLNRIELSVFSHNERGVRAYRRAGFVQEGCQRQAFYRNGNYHDVLLFGMLRRDWERLENDDADAYARLASMTT
ncbi:MAG: GNAT family N-acetyltransferase [Phycisphaerales bacterium]|nr:GNAT family N-acetyltransferase [Phycisphaerales bacterium]